MQLCLETPTAEIQIQSAIDLAPKKGILVPSEKWLHVEFGKGEAQVNEVQEQVSKRGSVFASKDHSQLYILLEETAAPKGLECIGSVAPGFLEPALGLGKCTVELKQVEFVLKHKRNPRIKGRAETTFQELLEYEKGLSG